MKYTILILNVLAFFYCIHGSAQDTVKITNSSAFKDQYKPEIIKPSASKFTQTALDNAVKSFYSYWKKTYIIRLPNTNQAYILNYDNTHKSHTCVSESQGYGMIIVALMGKWDSSAEATYDSLYNYYTNHLSQLYQGNKREGYLMSAAQNDKGEILDKTSASDGDIDIAYSLLLANRLWHNKGSIDYFKAAKAIIGDIMDFEINQTTWTIFLDNNEECDNSYTSKGAFGTRTSDFIPVEFKAFGATTQDPRWNKVVDTEYRLFDSIQNRYSPGIGLVPDYIIHLDGTPQPPSGFYQERSVDGQYDYNACRVPWRIAFDYIQNGDTRAIKFLKQINDWIRQVSGGDPNKVYNGYKLSGDFFKANNDMCFTAPFAVSAMIDKSNQPWLDTLWAYILNPPQDYLDAHNDGKKYFKEYYNDSIKMLNMLIITGNYWKPD